MQPKTSRADFEALVRRSGMPLSEAQIADIHANAWPIMEKLTEMVRAGVRERSAEPSHVFTPEGA
ncbi:MAG: hypothetical protein NT133_03060 [Alphaproteobacteria bacterium]|nr:hypothetical protein [Alphaproteobacteria bacterium]